MVENVICHFTLHCKCRRAYFLHYLLIIRLGHTDDEAFVFGLDIKSCDHHIIQWNGHTNFNFTIIGIQLPTYIDHQLTYIGYISYLVISFELIWVPMGSRAFWKQILKNETNGHRMKEVPSIRFLIDYY
jgi:hypothetical protein